MVYSSGSLVFSVVKYGCIIHCFVTYGFAVTICEGKSMEPYITSGDCFISERFSVRTYRLQRGDVVGVRYYMDPNCFVCKRIVGFEGDKVYNSTTQHHVWVPKGHVWLEGDNKERSLDSRNYGPVPYALIDTKLLFKILPAKASR
ncbi:mitochondrial inner membrane protease subunit 1-like isoform X2 [Mya arenaria]|nr:mitochondrial inner membrane protease subunit 1-like isoform X2 [Mya arenaria]XP_052800929.1 mitochondrial inner membrane protease subunit 1-like isoform X2 [Mya arenaria]